MNELITDRLTLQVLQPEHAAGLFPIWGDAEVTRFTYMRLVKDMNACTKNAALMMEAGAKREDVGPYVILLGSMVIGMAGAARLSRESSEYELYYHLGRLFWGHGFATEAACAVVDRVFSLPLVHRLSAEVVADNAASIRVLEKTGMKREGRLRGKFYKDGIYRDLYVYSILRNEWQQCKAMDTVRPALGQPRS